MKTIYFMIVWKSNQNLSSNREGLSCLVFLCTKLYKMAWKNAFWCCFLKDSLLFFWVAGLYSLTLWLFQKAQRVKSCNLYMVAGLYSFWENNRFLYRVLHFIFCQRVQKNWMVKNDWDFQRVKFKFKYKYNN